MTWVLVPNPEFEGVEPRILEPACHDHTPFVTVCCGRCGQDNHVHESQFEGAPEDAEFGMRCAFCRHENVSTIRFFRAAFAHLREEGWYR